MDAANPVWGCIWNVIREISLEGYALNIEVSLQIRSTHINKIMTKILKLSSSIQVNNQQFGKLVFPSVL